MTRTDILPDDVLLDIFDFYMDMIPSYWNKTEIEAWQLLVHVCRQWRSLIFRSPRRLNLRLFCTPGTPARDTLDVWPALPLLIGGYMGYMSSLSDADGIIVALGQSNRVCLVDLLGLVDWQLKKVLAAMQAPFPKLTRLELISHGETQLVAPDAFLGGSAPRLRLFQLDGIPFPGLPKLLLSATDLVHLELSNIPHSGYISPEAMATLLSVLSSLKTLHLQFLSPRSHPDWESRRPPPPKCSVIPALDHFTFKGVIDYLEDLVTFIDAPQLNRLHISFFNQIDFDGPRLAQFISRTPILRYNDVHVQFDNMAAWVRLPSPVPVKEPTIRISCKESDWQLSSVAQVCNSCLPPLSMIEDLYIERGFSRLVWKNGAIGENTLWLELLLPFPAVENLYLSKVFARRIAAALEEIVGTELLPSLRNIFVEAQGRKPLVQFRKNIRKFVAARQLSGHSITVSIWKGPRR